MPVTEPIETRQELAVERQTVAFARHLSEYTPRQIGRYGFILCTVGLLWLAFVVHNDWSAVPVLLGLVLFGIGQGATGTSGGKAY